VERKKKEERQSGVSPRPDGRQPNKRCFARGGLERKIHHGGVVRSKKPRAWAEVLLNNAEVVARQGG
jgi:hypothetical protein